MDEFRGVWFSSRHWMRWKGTQGRQEWTASSLMEASLTLEPWQGVYHRCVDCTQVVLSSKGLGMTLHHVAHLLIHVINQSEWSQPEREPVSAISGNKVRHT